MNPDLVIFSFSNESVRNLNFAPFLSVYGPQKLPSGARLKQMQGRLLIAVEGYDDKTGELYEFPEVRQFYRKFYEVFPYWLYFLSLETDCLKIMELSLLKSFTALKRDGFAQVQVEYDPVELIRQVGQQFMPMNVMCERAGMTEAEIYNLSRDVFHYFGFPYGDEVSG
jgi:hypothetical protein